MSLGLVFWILMLLWLILGAVWNRDAWTWPTGSGNWLLFFLLLLLGWKAFGAPIHG